MITDYIIKKYIKNFTNESDTEVRRSYGILEGKISLVANLFLFIIKLVSGVFIGSIAVVADAFHSLSNMQSSVAVLWGFNLAGAPPDRKHPYGYGRMEQVTTLIVAIILIISGVEFFKASLQRVVNPSPVLYRSWAVGAILLSIIISEWLAQFSKKISKRISSQTMRKDFISHRSDVITSLLTYKKVSPTVFLRYGLSRSFI